MYPISYQTIIGFIVNNAIFTIIIPVVVTVVSLVLYDIYRDLCKKPKLVIECDNTEKGKLGFSVYVRKKELEQATVRCNNKKYIWKREDGLMSDTFDLRIGDAPLTFYPFDVNVTFEENLPKHEIVTGIESESPFEPIKYSGGVRLVVKETMTSEIVYNDFYALPKEHRWLVWFSPWDIDKAFNVRIRIVAKGNEEESDYILRIGLNSLLIHPIVNDKPLMDYVEWDFNVKKTSKYFYRKRRKATLIY